MIVIGLTREVNDEVPRQVRTRCPRSFSPQDKRVKSACIPVRRF